MSTTSFIRRHIFQLPVGKLFTTRDFLIYGPRTAVDQTLFKLVKKEIIIRLSRGVFVRAGTDIASITIFEIAKTKAESFGKQIASWGGQVAVELGLPVAENIENTEKPNNKHIFSVNGSSSSFKYGKERIYLKKACARKILLGNQLAGKILKALWHTGKQQVNNMQVSDVMNRCRRPDRDEIRVTLSSLPAWLSAYFVKRTLPLAYCF